MQLLLNFCFDEYWSQSQLKILIVVLLVFIILPIFMKNEDFYKIKSHLFLSIFSTWYHQLLLWWLSLTIQNQVGTSKCRGILSSAEVWTDCTPWSRRRGWGRTWTGCRGVSGGRWWCCTSDSWLGLQGTVEVTVFQPILFLTEVLSFCSTTSMTNHSTCNKIIFHNHLNHEDEWECFLHLKILVGYLYLKIIFLLYKIIKTMNI